MRTWTQTELSDIRRDYRTGVTIEILADLNACKQDEIYEIVGAVKPIQKIKPPKDKLKPVKMTEENKAILHAKFREHYDSGASDNEIERRMNCSLWIIRAWRKGAGLPCVESQRGRLRKT